MKKKQKQQREEERERGRGGGEGREKKKHQPKIKKQEKEHKCTHRAFYRAQRSCDNKRSFTLVLLFPPLFCFPSVYLLLFHLHSPRQNLLRVDFYSCTLFVSFVPACQTKQTAGGRTAMSSWSPGTEGNRKDCHHQRTTEKEVRHVCGYS
jgi:hypothetical protein